MNDNHISNIQEQNSVHPPKEAYFYLPRGNEIIIANKKHPEKSQRILFDGIHQYTAYEKAQLSLLDQEIDARNKNSKKGQFVLPPDWQMSDSLRFLQAEKFKISETIDAIKKHLEWRKNIMQIPVTHKVMEILNLGFIYVHGRDNRYRPIIIINSNVFLDNEKKYTSEEWHRAIIYILDYTLENLMIKGQVETWNILVDVGRINVFNIPNDLKNFMVSQQENYRCRLHALYLINLGGLVNFLWKIIKGTIDKVIERKIKFIKSKDTKELITHINLSQLERKFGGYASDLSVGEFFPPTMPSEDYLLPTENFRTVLTTSKDYLKLYINKSDIMQVNPYIRNAKTTLEENDSAISDPDKRYNYENRDYDEEYYRNNQRMEFTPDPDTQEQEYQYNDYNYQTAENTPEGEIQATPIDIKNSQLPFSQIISSNNVRRETNKLDQFVKTKYTNPELKSSKIFSKKSGLVYGPENATLEYRNDKKSSINQNKSSNKNSKVIFYDYSNDQNKDNIKTTTTERTERGDYNQTIILENEFEVENKNGCGCKMPANKCIIF